MLHRMPVRMSPMDLSRGDKSIMLRAGRVPKMDGKPVELTPAELVQLRRAGIVPVEQAKPRPFIRKTTLRLRELGGVMLNVMIKDVPPGETVEGVDLGETEGDRGSIKADLDGEGWDLLGLPDKPLANDEPVGKPLARIKPKRILKSEARP